MKRLPALAGALALLCTPPQAGAQTYHQTRHLSDAESTTVKVLKIRRHVHHFRLRAWHYQDMRGAKRSETRYLERHVHAIPRLVKLHHYWYTLAVTARKNLIAHQRVQARAKSAATPAVDSCTDALLGREGGYNPHATNPSSGAYGGPQALPGSKMASAGADWADNIWTQIRWMQGYMNERYGGSCAALAHSYAYGWY